MNECMKSKEWSQVLWVKALPLRCQMPKDILRKEENILIQYQNDKELNKDFKHETEVIDNLDFQYPEDGQNHLRKVYIQLLCPLRVM